MRSWTLLLGIFTSFSGFIYGYDSGMISGLKATAPFVRAFGQEVNGNWAIPATTSALLTSVLSIGTMPGTYFSAALSDRFGRKPATLFYIAVFTLGVLLQLIARSVALMCVGRAIAGVGLGGVYCIVPIFQAECAPQRVRGVVVSAYQTCSGLGLLVAAGVVQRTSSGTGEGAFRLPIGLQFIWALLVAIGTSSLPESPRFLIAKGREEAGRRSLSVLLGQDLYSKAVSAVYDEIHDAVVRDAQLASTGRWRDCVRMGAGKNLLRVGTVVGIQAFQQLSGINFLYYFSTTFFQSSGVSSPFTATTVVAAVTVVGAMLGGACVDKVGRRPMLIWGAAGMAISQIIIAAVGFASPSSGAGTQNLTPQRVQVAFACIFAAVFSGTWGVVRWAVASEIAPQALRGKAMALGSATSWGLVFALTFVTPYLVDKPPEGAGLGSSVFFIWGGVCVAAFVFAYFVIYETKGLSLEQVDTLIRASSPVRSEKVRKTMLGKRGQEAEIAAQEGSWAGDVEARGTGVHESEKSETSPAAARSPTSESVASSASSATVTGEETEKKAQEKDAEMEKSVTQCAYNDEKRERHNVARHD